MGGFYNRFGIHRVVGTDLEIDSGTLSVDEVNNRVGVGTTSPDSTLHVAGSAAFSGPSETFVTFSSSDTTPSVATGNLFKTHASGQTLTMLDDGVAGQTVTIISTAAVVFDVTSTNLKGGSADITTASGDVTTWTFDGTDWYLQQFMDLSADMSTVGDISTVTAGVGLSGGGTSGDVTLTLDLSELSAVTPANGDSFATLDSDGAVEQLTTITALGVLQAGTAATTGLSTSAGVLSVSDLHPVGVDGANNQILTDDGDGTVTSEAKLTFDGTTLLVDTDVTATTNHTTVGSHINYDATGIIASGQVGLNVGLDIDVNSDSPTMVGTVVNYGIDIDLVGGTSGAQTNIGLDISATGADVNYGAVIVGTQADVVLGAADTNATVLAARNHESGTDAGKALTISAGSTTTGANNLNGGDLTLAAGGGDGTGTSSIVFKTKVSGADAAEERLRIDLEGAVEANYATADAFGAGLSGAASKLCKIAKVNGVIETTILIDITGLDSHNTVAHVIGDSSGSAELTKLTFEKNGYIYRVEMACIETPASAGSVTTNINLTADTSARDAGFNFGGVSSDAVALTTGAWVAFQFEATAVSPAGAAVVSNGLDDRYLHLSTGAGSGGAGVYNAGKFMIKLYGIAF